MPAKQLILFSLFGAALIAGCTSVSNGRRVSYSDVPRASHSQMETFARSVRPVRGDIQAKYDLARHFQRIQHHTIAIEALKEILRIDPGHADAHNALGYSYDCTGDFRTARQHYRIAVALNPDLDYAYNNLGYSFILDGAYSAAIVALEQAVALKRHQKYIKNLSYAYFKTGNLKMADLTLRGLDDPTAAHRIKVRLGMISETADPVDKGKPQPGDEALPAEKDHRLRKPDGRVSDIHVSEDRVAYLPFLPDPTVGDEPAYLPLIPSGPDPRKTSDPCSEDIITSRTYRGSTSRSTFPPVGATAIEVSNGNGVRRMAGSVGRYLQRLGMRVARLTNAGHFHHPRTVIYYRDGYFEAASEVERLLPGLSSGGHLVAVHLDREPIRVLIGRDLASYAATAYRDIDVDVTNGNGMDGLASRLSGRLRRGGFRVGRLSNADHFSFARSVVFYGKGKSAQARLIADALPGEGRYRLIELNDIGMHIQVFMGADMVF